MGAQVLEAEPVAIFDEEEKYTAQFSMRAPPSLAKGVARMRKAEKLRSVNEARVRAMRMGLAVYELLAQHPEAVGAVRSEERLTVEEAAARLLSEGLSRWEKRGRR